jgi:glycosyltransferase involved in cell wall biosynthesis
MNANPTISVVTVCKNAAATIEPTLRSVSAQTYRNIEYIVVDGASADGTPHILRRHAGVIATWVSEPDTGLYNAMNKALKLFTGGSVVFLNAGDTFASDVVVERAAAEWTAHPEAGLIYGDCWEVEGATRRRRPHPPLLTPWKLWLNALCHQAVFARRDVFERVGGFDESLRVCADWDWTIRAVLGSGIRTAHWPDEIACFTLGGISSNREAFERDVREIRKRHFSPAQRLVFSIRELGLKVSVRLRRGDYSLPWSIRKRWAP